MSKKLFRTTCFATHALGLVVTPNNALDYWTNGLYITPKPNPSVFTR